METGPLCIQLFLKTLGVFPLHSQVKQQNQEDLNIPFKLSDTTRRRFKGAYTAKSSYDNITLGVCFHPNSGEKKILPPLWPGIELAIFQSQVWSATSELLPSPPPGLLDKHNFVAKQLIMQTTWTLSSSLLSAEFTHKGLCYIQEFSASLISQTQKTAA